MFDKVRHRKKVEKLEKLYETKLKKSEDSIGCLYLLFFSFGLIYLIFFVLDLLGVFNESHFISDNSSAILLAGGVFFTVLIMIMDQKNGAIDNFKQLTEKLQHSEKELMDVEKMIDSKKSFLLYLRDFEEGRAITRSIPDFPGVSVSGIPNPMAWEKKFGKQLLNVISEYCYKRRLPVVMLHNDWDRSDLKNTYVLYPSNDIWFEEVKILIEKSRYIVLDFSHITEAIENEIEYIIEVGRRKVVFCGTNNWLTVIQRKFPSLQGLILAKILYDEKRIGNRYYDLSELKRIF